MTHRARLRCLARVVLPLVFFLAAGTILPAMAAESAPAAPPPAVNAGDTAWLLVSAALVMIMTPGLAL
ncbi:MAG: ammonia channel protein, partial [Candidatus Deferrimicrobiota bacterium]